MTSTDTREALEKAGYKITSVINGGYVAKKGSRTYTGETLTDLYNKTLKPEW